MTAGRRLRVLHVLEAVEGGTSRHLIELCRTVDAEHHVALPARRRGAGTDPLAHAQLQSAGAVLHHLAMERATVSPGNLRSLALAVRIVRRVQPDVVHGHSSVGGAVARIAGAATRTPSVFTPNGVLTTQPVLAVERLLGRITGATVAVSASEERLIRELRMARPGRLHTVPNTIDPALPAEPFVLRERLGIPSSERVILCISRLVPQKAPLDAVAAFEHVVRDHGQDDPGHLVIIGDGPLRDDVVTAVHDHGLDGRVHLLSLPSAAGGLLPQAQALLLTSRYEGAPYVLLEAFRAGVPAVATDCVGTTDIIDDGINGLLARVGDVSAVAAALRRVLGDPATAAELVAGGNRTLADRYSPEAAGKQLLDLYGALTADRR